ncbi:MAG TPA: hypothetical protein DET40_18250 [Lentisphaeria bacterium]|nr:MAG: hypothetical protein A2X45_14390 [Lentisphaerae bacterium GWF2_50_93]HCE45486.1 hypothetical protein [Lentisphaeria bacterium]
MYTLKKKSKSAISKAKSGKLVHQLCGILKSRDGSPATGELLKEHARELTPAQKRWASKRFLKGSDPFGF